MICRNTSHHQTHASASTTAPSAVAPIPRRRARAPLNQMIPFCHDSTRWRTTNSSFTMPAQSSAMMTSVA